MKSSLISIDADLSLKLGLFKPLPKHDDDGKDGKHGKDKDWDYGKGKDHDNDHGKGKGHDKDWDKDHGKHADKGKDWGKDDDCDSSPGGHDDDCDLQAVLCSLPDIGAVLDCAISHLDCGSDACDVPQCDSDFV